MSHHSSVGNICDFGALSTGIRFPSVALDINLFFNAFSVLHIWKCLAFKSSNYLSLSE